MIVPIPRGASACRPPLRRARWPAARDSGRASPVRLASLAAKLLEMLAPPAGRRPAPRARPADCPTAATRRAASRAASPLQALTKLRSGRGRLQRSLGCGPASTSSASAVSRTVRVSTPWCDERFPTARKGHVRHATHLRLQSEHAAETGRNADRTAAIAGRGQRTDAAGDRRRRAAARTAGVVVELPRIVRIAKDRIAGQRNQPELRSVGLAQDDRAGLFETLDNRLIPVGRKMFEEFRSQRGADAGRQVQIFDRQRHAVQWRELVAAEQQRPRPRGLAGGLRPPSA